ncbi:plasma membrane fusion protein prm1 [Malassezia psittaci]|uniref:Plasma membrane fusion protein PRM1 n=1 Tax=Malassezia psittaci TaxID=1821823 RepID=A0AAF0JF03_9BASI|nr:plasma membrane fusion protein prm1 [Malassezia psittaci]
MQTALQLLGIIPLLAWSIYRAVSDSQQRKSRIIDLLQVARQDWQLACEQFDATTNAVRSWPQTAAFNTGNAALKSIEIMLRALAQILIAILSLAELALNWFLTSYRALFVCTVQLVIQSALALLDAATQAIADAVKAAGQALEALLRTVLSAAQGTADVATDALNDLLGFFGKHVNSPQWNEPAALQLLRNITLPSSLVQPFRNVQLPTVDSLRNATKQSFDLPFEGIQTKLNTTITNLNFQLPTQPAIPTSKPICSDVDWSAFDDAVRAIKKTSWTLHLKMTIGIILLLGFVLLTWMVRPAPCNPSRSYKSECMRRARSVAACPILMFVLALMLLHLGLSEMEIAILRAIVHQVDHLPRMSALPSPMSSWNSTIFNQEINAQISQVQMQINDVFEDSVQKGVPSVLAVLNAVFDVIASTIQDVLGATPLGDPVREYMMCVIGNKILQVESALESLRSSLNLQLPMLPQNEGLPDISALVTNSLGSVTRDVFRPVYNAANKEFIALEHDQIAALTIFSTSLAVATVYILCPRHYRR